MTHPVALTDEGGERLRIAFVYKLTIKEPLGIAYLSAYLKKYGPPVEIRFFDPKVDPVEALQAFAPQLVLFSIMSSQYLEMVARNRRLKKVLPDYMAVFGGPHPTYFPEMIHDEGVDAVCQGEGEEPLLQLVNALTRGESITGIPGLWVNRSCEVWENGFAAPIQNLDALPYPDRELFYDKSPLYRGSFAKTVFTARGCPFRCSYCYNSALNDALKGQGKVLRYRSPESVVEEIRKLRERYPVPFIMFGDDVFAGVNVSWMRRFSELYAPLEIPYNISIRAEQVNPAVVEYLAKSGCISVALAIEHGDEAYRKTYLYRNMSDERLISSIRMLEDSGIRVVAPTMVGLPFTDVEGDMKTVRLVQKAAPTYAGVTVFQPYPELPLTKLCLERGVVDRNYVDVLNVDCYRPAHIKGVDYGEAMRLRDTFGLIQFFGAIWPDRLDTIARKMPRNFFTRHFNTLVNFFSFNKIYPYRRGVSIRLWEIFIGLDTGAYGLRLPAWFRRRERF